MLKLNFSGPVVLAILDGVGLAPAGPGNAVSNARLPFLTHIVKHYPHLSLAASGPAVGLTENQMGNSEVGHNTMGCGQILKHGIAYIDAAFDSGEIWHSRAWLDAIKNVLNPDNIDKNDNPWYNETIIPKTLHFAGIFSDGGVHSHITHLEKMIEKAYAAGVRKMRVHAIFDGRDVAPKSEPNYINRLEDFSETLEGLDLKIASGGGRMTTLADRYENDWGMVERGFKMIRGASPRHFHSAIEAITSLRSADPDLQDQYLPDFIVVNEKDQPVGPLESGDSLIYFDFRADRAIEPALAFTAIDFSHFDRGNFSPSDIYFAGLTEYNSDSHVPKNQLVPPLKIKDTLNTFLGAHGISQFAISETAKFGHITYYFDGNSYEKAPGEVFEEVPSDTEPFNSRPWMKSAEITDSVIKHLEHFRFVRLNFPGGDMVGHFADLDATVIALESIDLSLRRIAQKVDELSGCLIIVADHGNAEELLDASGAPKTSHTTNRVPCIFYDNTVNRDKYQIITSVAPISPTSSTSPTSSIPSPVPSIPSASSNYAPTSATLPLADPSLANLASTLAILLGAPDYPASWQPPLIRDII